MMFSWQTMQRVCLFTGKTRPALGMRFNMLGDSCPQGRDAELAGLWQVIRTTIVILSTKVGIVGDCDMDVGIEQLFWGLVFSLAGKPF